MGGRGSYSGKPTKKEKPKPKGPLGGKVLHHNKDNLTDIGDVAKSSNPNFASGKKGYTINCQR